YFYSGAVIPYGIQDQDTTICGLAADAPFFEKIDRVALDVGAIERIDGHERDLSMGLFIDLTSDLSDLPAGIGVKDVREIIDVTGWLQLCNGLGPCPNASRPLWLRAAVRN